MISIGIAADNADKTLVETLSDSLENHGLRSLHPSLTSLETFEVGIENIAGICDVMLFIITQNSKGFDFEKARDVLKKSECECRFLVFDNSLIKVPGINNSLIIDFTEFIEGLSTLLGSIHESKSIELYGKIQNPSKINPFGKIRAEFFDGRLLANTFHEPEKEKYELLRGESAVILEGGRGSGKTMLLRSLEVTTAIERSGKTKFEDSGLEFFGVYLKMDRGGIMLTSEKEIEQTGEKLSKTLFIDDFNLQFTESLIETIAECLNSDRFTIGAVNEKEICKNISKILNDIAGSKRPESWSSLLDWIRAQKREIRKFVASSLMVGGNTYNGGYSEVDAIQQIWLLISSNVVPLNNKTLFLLLDEYESLLESQQVVINTLIKKSNEKVSLKVATKYEGLYTRKTLVGQDIQAVNDYQNISLDYDLKEPRSLTQYKDLLKHVSKNLLSENGFDETDISVILQDGDEIFVTDENMREEYEKMLSAKGKDISEINESIIKEKISYYKDALIFRALRTKQKRRKKTYCGFNTFTHLSSGIIRQFMELCGMAYYLAEQNGEEVSKMKTISSEIQTQAVQNVSSGILEKIAPGIENLGLTMQLFLIDMSDLYRTKLHFDNTEPETLRIGIKDPITNWPKNLLDLYKTGIRESVFQKIGNIDATKPRSTSYSRPLEIIINRILCPVMEISYHTRWRSDFGSSELSRMINPKTKIEEKKSLNAKMKKDTYDSSNEKITKWSQE
ncbi:hypothetical protein [Nitrosopumilus sp.]|uniref:ORC-CDC6 family AAA ATPase n=1 Tax=Nitrosopumilus sp. TaxID=2024843 RepID=UPI003D0B6049